MQPFLLCGRGSFWHTLHQGWALCKGTWCRIHRSFILIPDFPCFLLFSELRYLILTFVWYDYNAHDLYTWIGIRPEIQKSYLSVLWANKYYNYSFFPNDSRSLILLILCLLCPSCKFERELSCWGSSFIAETPSIIWVYNPLYNHQSEFGNRTSRYGYPETTEEWLCKSWASNWLITSLR